MELPAFWFYLFFFIKDIHDQNFTEKIYVMADDLDKQLIEKLSSLGVDTLKPDQLDSQNQLFI